MQGLFKKSTAYKGFGFSVIGWYWAGKAWLCREEGLGKDGSCG